MEKIDKLKNRQLAKLLTHLERTGQLTVELEKDLKRWLERKQHEQQ